jgi:hypothetical protein
VNWFLDQVILTLNIVSIGIIVAVAYSGFGIGSRSYAVWKDRARWLPPTAGLLFAVLGALPVLAIYWISYRLTGFPNWMRWLAN